MFRNKYSSGLDKGGYGIVQVDIKSFSWQFCSRYNLPKQIMWRVLRILRDAGLIKNYNRRAVYLSFEAYSMLLLGGDKKCQRR